MTEFVDGGDILKQSHFDIDEDENAFTLNIKCYNAAIKSFAELVDDLSSDHVSARKQNLDERTFFSRYKRPSKGCVLSWNRSAHDIDTFVRALYFGSYPNPIGFPKLAIGTDFLIVSEIEVLYSNSAVSPGTITHIDPNFVRVSTVDGEIALHKLLTIDGHPLPISDFVAYFGLYEGYQFKELDQEIATRITSYNASMCQHEAFWLKHLETLEKYTLPFVHHKISHPHTTRYMHVPTPIPKEVITFLENHNVAWRMEDFLVAAFAAYLARIGGTWSFDIGYRDIKLARELADLEGMFAGYVPLHINLEYRQSFEDVFYAVQEQVKLAKQEKTYVRDILARYPTLRSKENLQGVYLPSVFVEQSKVRHDYKASDNSEFTLVILEGGEECLWVYNAKVLDEESLMKMQHGFITLLQSIISNPQQRISDLQLLPKAEQNRLLVEWNTTEATYPQELCIHQLFESQVKRTPDAVAVVFEDQQLTYHELNVRANQLAHHLRQLRIGPEVLVGLCVERSLEMVIGVLGVLKTGGAYVPLDPTYPFERLSFIRNDAKAPVLVTQQHLTKNLGAHGAKVICLDTDQAVLGQQSEANPISEVVPDNLAYVIYTSGSTGQPKGVQIPHRAVINFLTAMRQQPGLSVEDSLLAVTTLSFDIAALELFLPLITGARLIVASRDVVSNGAELADILVHSCAAVMQATPITWRMLLAAGWEGNPRLKILCGGEALPLELARQLLPRVGSLWNLYGPTETTIWSTVCKIEPTEESVSIGRPLANTQIYLLDLQLQPAPIGLPGELYIGGDGLARGYLNHPELTAERFISHPYSDYPGARLYKTGDLARYRLDGSIEVIGRLDHQVKIRGIRIEPGEIEAVLDRHPAVREVVVVASDDAIGEKCLVAYMVLHKKQAVSMSELQNHVMKYLPTHMVPSAFMILETFPQTPNGKIDRRALPKPDWTKEDDITAPRNPIEEILVGIWTEVLDIKHIGIHTHFFEVGSHSLIATQVIARVRDVFQVELPLRSLFEARTVAQLAKRIEMARKIEQSFQVPLSLRSNRQEDLPLSFAQQRLWFLDQLQCGSPVYNISVAYRLRGTLNVAALEQSLNEIVRHHKALRTTFPAVDGQPIQVIAPTLTIKLTPQDLQNLPTTERQAEAVRLATDEAQQPFDLAKGPLLRVKLLQISEVEHVLLLTIHHIVSDGWSLGILYQEIGMLYDAYAQGKVPQLPELPIQYADYALWQREWLRGEVLESELAYWKSQLAGAPPALELPTDQPRPEVETFRGAYEPFALPVPLVQALKDLGQRERATLFMTLLAAFQILLARYSQQDDIVVGTDVANRKRVEVEGLIGFFVNQLVLRTDLSGNPSFRELLRRVREVVLDAYEHQDVPFDRLVQALNPVRYPNRSPMFQVKLVLQNMPAPPNFSAITVDPLWVDNGTAQLDLLLALNEDDTGLQGAWQYNTDIFDIKTITAMSRHFHVLLETLVASPSHTLSALNAVLDEVDTQQKLALQHQLAQARHQRFKRALAKPVIVFRKGD